MSLLYSIQEFLIFPGRISQGQSYARLITPRHAKMVEIRTACGEKISALLGYAIERDGNVATDFGRRPTLLFFYGNSSCLSYSLVEFENFRRLGVNVMIPDYVGYGLSSGKVSEQGCYAAAEACYDYLSTGREVDANKIISSGWSLGSAVAINLATNRQVIGLATFSAFTSMYEMAKRTYPIIPIPSKILLHRFESEKKIADLNCPVFVCHGKNDAFIPWQMSERLAQTTKGNVTRHYIDGADHADIFDVGGDRVLAAFANFIKSCR